jgi:Trypsin
MFRFFSATALVAAFFAMCGTRDASAIVLGSASSLGAHTVQIASRGRLQCSGVAIDRNVVVTAAHCLSGGDQVLAGGAPIAVIGRMRRITISGGARIRVAGDAVILRLARAMPGVTPIPVGNGRAGGAVTVAGYGTVDERQPGAVGALHEARLVPTRGRLLVDPNRAGSLGASACFGDSGGPVVRGGALIGVITRANYPHARIACGWYTQWAPVMASGRTRIVASTTAAREATYGAPTAAYAPGFFGAFPAAATPKAGRLRKHHRRAHRKHYRRRHLRRHARRHRRR